MMTKEARFALAGAVALMIVGCAAPQPRVVYVPYPPPGQVAAPATPAPAPIVAQKSEEDLEAERSWRTFCIETASEVDQYVYARDEGYDFTVVRDWALEQEAQTIDSLRAAATTRAEHEEVDTAAEVTLMMTQRMVQQVYQRPFGDAEQERALWIESCMELLD